jgi:hypothetical protein
MWTAALAPVVLQQALLSAAVGTAVYLLLWAQWRTGWRRAGGLVLLLAVVQVEVRLLPAPLAPRGQTDPAHVAAFLMAGSGFLLLTRVIHFTWLDKGLPFPLERLPSLPVFCACFFTAPLALAHVSPAQPAWRRYRQSLDQHPWRALLKLAMLAFLLRAVVPAHRPLLQQSLLVFSLLGNAILYLLLSGLEDACAAGLELGLGVEFWPSFDRPWMATTFGEFWRFRWHTPFREANALVLQRGIGTRLPRPVGTVLVFAFSGACHTLQVWAVTHEISPTMMAFFLVAWAQVSVGDPWLKRWLAREHGTARLWGCRAIVVGSLCASSLLFWHPLWQHAFLQGMAEMV